MGLFVLVAANLDPSEYNALSQFVAFVASVPIIVAVHRAIVLQESIKPTNYFPSFLQRKVWRFFGYCVLWFVAVFPVGGGIGFGIAFAGRSAVDHQHSFAIADRYLAGVSGINSRKFVCRNQRASRYFSAHRFRESAASERR